MRQPQDSGSGQRSHDSAGWILCWLAMVTLVSISFAGSREKVALRISVTETSTTEAKSPDLELAQFPNLQGQGTEKSQGPDRSEGTSAETDDPMTEFCPQG
ncbi:MAG: hypothetical protein IT581_00660 [Verrucomicrobiales bacterium]|nr:hypothetical protein [Verrucomicrobiales bacterium]